MGRFSGLCAGITLIAALQGGAAHGGEYPVSSGNKWEHLSAAGVGGAEGVVAGPDGAIYLVDNTHSLPSPHGSSTVLRYDPKSRQTTKVLEPSEGANGMAISPSGNVIVCESGYDGGRDIVERDLANFATKKRVLTSNYQGKRFTSPNDLALDSKGRIYFTDARFSQKETPELPNAVYRLDPDSKLTQLDTGVLRPNGIEISPDGKRLYVAATVVDSLLPNPLGPTTDRYGFTFGGVAVFDLAEDGSISNGRSFWRNDQGLVDGTAMDTEGNLYVAVTNLKTYNQIAVISPLGELLEALPLPAPTAEGAVVPQPVNLGFGRGEDAHSLYLATKRPWGLWRLKTTKTGFNQF